MKSYQSRLMEYEQCKRKLQAAGLTAKEYEQAIRELCRRLNI